MGQAWMNARMLKVVMDDRDVARRHAWSREAAERLTVWPALVIRDAITKQRVEPALKLAPCSAEHAQASA